MQSYVIHLIRHGMTDANIKGQYAGSWDIPVCAQGEEKLKNLKNSFEYPHVEKIYTSPLSRCIQTCGIIYSGLEPIIVDGLKECNFGDWEGKTPYELSEDPTHSEWMKKGNSVVPPNGESWNAMFERVSQSFEDIVKNMMTERIFSSAIFTHGGVIMSILYRYGLPKAEFLDWMVENGCGYSVRITPGLWMRDKVFEVYDRLPIGADVELSGGLKNIIDHMKKAEKTNFKKKGRCFMSNSEHLRNIAIIAHVDHGKTTLVDQMLKQSGIFRTNESVEERVMDSNDLERERGITILSKNTAVMYKDIKINIVDTPGHADFGGEVERILMMVDGVLLLVDAFEGCMPQTRFVLKKALKLGKKPIVVVNKIDRNGARPEEVIDEVLDLFIELGADESQIEFPVVYASGRNGYAYINSGDSKENLKPLFETIINEVPCPKGDENGPLQVLISNIDYDDYVGRIGVGRVERGKVRSGQNAILCTREGDLKNVKIGKLYTFEGLKRTETDEAGLGEIISISGITGLNIGETLCDPEHVEALPFVKIDEPTVSMNFMVNNSPFAGREGKFVTSRNVRDRLFKEIETNVSMRVEETDSADTFKVSGRGELHLSILIETMRREGYEFQVSRPKVIMKEIDGKLCEPMEILSVEVPEEYVGTVIEKIGSRKAEMISMNPKDGGMTLLEFKVPSRAIIGYRSEFLTDTNGKGILNQMFDSYEPYKGEIIQRHHGSLVAHETGVSTGYGLFASQDRGRLFIGPGVDVYEGMVVGSTPKVEDITVNVCKKKHVTNMRAAGSDEALKLTPPSILSLEQSIEFLDDDELLEVTPKNIRIRKKILDKTMRLRSKVQKSQ